MSFARVRRGFAITNIEQRRNEQYSDTKKRMITILKKINEAKIKGHGLLNEQACWASVNKNAQEREKSSRASKTRKLLHILAPSWVEKAETEYSSGTLWLGDHMISSATRPKPKAERTLQGRVPTAWLAPGRLAQVVQIEAAKIEETWRDIMEN